MADEDNNSEEFDEVYDDEGREDLQKNDEISPEEEAFMAGYEESTEEKEEVEDDGYEESFESGKKKKK